MTLVDTALLVLPTIALVCSIIELGISGYVEHLTGNRYYFDALGSRSGFLIFCSVWTLLVSALLILLPSMSARKSGVSKSNTWVTPVTFILNLLTFIFWLAGFAALAALFPGYLLTGTVGAELAFAIILWLIFLAILIINILTALGILQTDRLGYSPMKRRRPLP